MKPDHVRDSDQDRGGGVGSGDGASSVGGDVRTGSDDDHHDRARNDAHPRPHRHPHHTHRTRTRTRRSDPTPPPPGGILWTIAGDIRALLMLPSALTMQVAHPAVGAGVDEYSVFRTDPWGRGERSVRSVLLWVYGGDEAAVEGRRLRALHRTIQGTDTRGHRYHALMPAAYAWVHATGFPVYRHAQRYLGRPFTEAEERQLYAEWLQVGRILGIHDRDMPRTPEEFWPYYRKILAEELELTPVARELTATDASVPPPDRGPRPVRALVRAAWPLLLPPLARFRRFLTIGLMPPDARQALGLPWTPRQERALRRFGLVVRTLVPLLPERLRYLPFARRARARHRAARH
ncbi:MULTISPECIES: oxygenase MpaB family protein [unclassified Streptomyces]|uniref:oxygenase MpaB family protein n=1 Tax=unclassified Streptomyces TaxID=2593676 RepID=UPI001CBEA0F9|nr:MULTISPECIES: oxygenase MpaB family protein [unclassified Streptomyces]WPO69876.1 oxygenase MpaB family protein [Streptomyces sp. KN37]